MKGSVTKLKGVNLEYKRQRLQQYWMSSVRFNTAVIETVIKHLCCLHLVMRMMQKHLRTLNKINKLMKYLFQDSNFKSEEDTYRKLTLKYEIHLKKTN